MAKPLKEYFEKETEKANMSFKINRTLFDQVNYYRTKMELTWPELLEALFQKLIDDEIKGKNK